MSIFVEKPIQEKKIVSVRIVRPTSTRDRKSAESEAKGDHGKVRKEKAIKNATENKIIVRCLKENGLEKKLDCVVFMVIPYKL